MPNAKLITTETSAIEGKIDNNAKAVVNLTITPSKEKLINKNKEEHLQVQYKTEFKTETNYECFYRTVLEAYMNIFIKQFVLFKTSVLSGFIRILAEADSVEITLYEDVEYCGKTTKINAVDTIIVIKDSVHGDFQFNYNGTCCFKII